MSTKEERAKQFFNAFKDKIKADKKENSFLQQDGGCFCLMEKGSDCYVAFSGCFDYPRKSKKLQFYIKNYNKKIFPKIKRSTRKVIALIYEVMKTNKLQYCQLTKDFFVWEGGCEYFIKELPCTPIELCKYVTLGDVLEGKTRKKLIFRNVFCAERKILRGIVKAVFQDSYSPKKVTEYFLGIRDFNDIELYGELNLDCLTFYSKYAPCNLCVPLCCRLAYYSIKYKKRLGDYPYKINFGEKYCKYIYPTIIK